MLPPHVHVWFLKAMELNIPCFVLKVLFYEMRPVSSPIIYNSCSLNTKTSSNSRFILVTSSRWVFNNVIGVKQELIISQSVNYIIDQENQHFITWEKSHRFVSLFLKLFIRSRCPSVNVWWIYLYTLIRSVWMFEY